MLYALQYGPTGFSHTHKHTLRVDYMPQFTGAPNNSINHSWSLVPVLMECSLACCISLLCCCLSCCMEKSQSVLQAANSVACVARRSAISWGRGGGMKWRFHYNICTHSTYIRTSSTDTQSQSPTLHLHTVHSEVSCTCIYVHVHNRLLACSLYSYV